jgi:hypothetical protein
MIHNHTTLSKKHAYMQTAPATDFDKSHVHYLQRTDSTLLPQLTLDSDITELLLHKIMILQGYS